MNDLPLPHAQAAQLPRSLNLKRLRPFVFDNQLPFFTARG
jgi:hypothetical protein